MKRGEHKLVAYLRVNAQQIGIKKYGIARKGVSISILWGLKWEFD